MFCRSMERGELARRLPNEDGEEAVDIGGDEDVIGCCDMSAWFSGRD